MTIEHVGIALRTQAPTRTAKLVLVAIAEAANAEDDIAWPSVPTMASYAQVSRSTLKRHRDALIDAGLIEPVDPADLSPNRRAQYESLPPNRRTRPYRVLLGVQIEPPDQGGHSHEPSDGLGGPKTGPWGSKTAGLGVHSSDPQTGITKPENKTSLGGQSEPPTPNYPTADQTRAALDAAAPNLADVVDPDAALRHVERMRPTRSPA